MPKDCLSTVPGAAGLRCLRALRFAFLLLACLALSACSGARFAYNHADTAVAWIANDYFGLEGAQEEDFNARLARFHVWHRSEELPRYSTLFATAGAKLADGMSEAELDWAWASVLGAYRRMAAQAAPDLAVVLVTLTPAQFERLEKKFVESNAEYSKKNIKGGVEKQRARRYKRNLELMREWFGELSDEQETKLKAASERLPLLYEQRLENRQRRQREFVAMLKAYHSPQELEPKLKRWLLEWDEGAAAEYLHATELHRAKYMRMLLELDRSLTPNQRQHAVSRFADFAALFTALAEQAKLARSEP